MTTDSNRDRSDRETFETPEERDVARLIRGAGPRIMPPEEFTREVRAWTHAVWREETARGFRQSGWLALAATLVLGSLVSFYALRPAQTELIAEIDRVAGSVEFSSDRTTWQRTGQGRFEPNTYLRTDRESRASLHLGNDVDLRLDHATTLRLTSSSQVDLLSGRVYIDSGAARNSLASIKVVTPLGEAQDIGTQFEVRVDEDSLQVRVREGTVLLARGSESYRSDAGEVVRVHAEGAVERSTTQPYDEDWAWSQGVAPLYDIDNRPLSDFLGWAAREIGAKLEFNSAFSEAAAEQTMLHGSIEGFTPREALAAILSTTDLRQISDDPGVILIDFK